LREEEEGGKRKKEERGRRREEEAAGRGRRRDDSQTNYAPQLRATVYQLRQRKTSRAVQSTFVQVRARRVQTRGSALGGHSFY
jgi:hypothetical protein